MRLKDVRIQSDENLINSVKFEGKNEYVKTAESKTKLTNTGSIRLIMKIQMSLQFTRAQY